MALRTSFGRFLFLRSIIVKNMLLFLLILLAAVAPLAVRYYQDSRDYEIKNLASRLEFFAERGASWLDPNAIVTLRQPDQKRTPAYRNLLIVLNRIKREFNVDNAIILRRETNGRYSYVAAGHDGFDIGQPAHIHNLFPATFKATNDTWLAGEMMHSQLFGGRVGDQLFDQFLQINTPLKINGAVVAILMLNKFANPVATAVRQKTIRVGGLSVGIFIVGLALFGLISGRMLRPLKDLTAVASEVADGNLAVTPPTPRGNDEIGRLTVTFSSMLEGLRQRDFIRDTFGRYLTKEVVEKLLDSPDGLKMGGEAREITLLVSDLRGFTSLSARLTPNEIIDILNRYLERMVGIIMRYRGTVDEFQGDGILAFFGAPIAAADDPSRAIACALEMQCALREFNTEQRRLKLPELAMGIGINTGEVVVGNIGSEQRAKYGAVGNAINVAYRIESYTLGGQIFISPSTYEQTQELLRVRGAQDVTFKGVDGPITLYDVEGLGGEFQLSLPEQASDVFATLQPPLPIVCHAVEGKSVSPHSIAGVITRLGLFAAETNLDEPVGMHGDLKIVFEANDGVRCEAYAKVEDAEQPANGAATRVRVVFTSMTDDARAYLATLRRHAMNEPPSATES